MAKIKGVLALAITVSIILRCYFSQEFAMPRFSNTFYRRHIDVTTQSTSSNDITTVYNAQEDHGILLSNNENPENVFVSSSNNITKINNSIIQAYRTVLQYAKNTKKRDNTMPKNLMHNVSDIFQPYDEAVTKTIRYLAVKKMFDQMSPPGNDNKTPKQKVYVSIKNSIDRRKESDIDNSSVSYDSNVVGTNDEYSGESEISATTTGVDIGYEEVEEEDKEKEDEVYHSTFQNDMSRANADNVAVIILTQKRSGSSFIGEIFNQNAAFTYFFEPLTSLTQRVLHYLMNGNLFGQYSSQIFNGILHRDFSNMPPGWWTMHVPSHICSSLTLGPIARLCGPNDHRKRPLSLTEKMALISSSTRSRKGVAVKTIRVQDLKFLKDFVTDQSLNVKILHLVRDPRGVMNSRGKLRERNYDLIRRKGGGSDEILDVCQHIERNLKYRQTDWLNGRYKVVRYEDAAEQPLKTASEIYKFIGLDLPDSVRVWLNTHTNHSSGSDFSHTRNSTRTAHAWRTQLDYRKVTEIQQKCANPMAQLGYTPILSYFDLRNVKFKSLGSFTAG